LATSSPAQSEDVILDEIQIEGDGVGEKEMEKEEEESERALAAATLSATPTRKVEAGHLPSTLHPQYI
jgi:hypothetical protein